MKYQPSQEAKMRMAMKKNEHDVKKQMKGFCSNPFCMYCKVINPLPSEV